MDQVVVAAPNRFQRIGALPELAFERVEAHRQVADDRFEAATLICNPRRKKPRREPPRPKLSQAALEGKVPLRTFGELSALFAAKKEPETVEATASEKATASKPARRRRRAE